MFSLIVRVLALLFTLFISTFSKLFWLFSGISTVHEATCLLVGSSDDTKETSKTVFIDALNRELLEAWVCNLSQERLRLGKHGGQEIDQDTLCLLLVSFILWVPLGFLMSILFHFLKSQVRVAFFQLLDVFKSFHNHSPVLARLGDQRNQGQV